MKDERPLRRVAVLGLDEGGRVGAPVAPWVQVVRGVVAVVEAEAVTLYSPSNQRPHPTPRLARKMEMERR
jgi:hypothetical protein